MRIVSMNINWTTTWDDSLPGAGNPEVCAVWGYTTLCCRSVPVGSLPPQTYSNESGDPGSQGTVPPTISLCLKAKHNTGG